MRFRTIILSLVLWGFTSPGTAIAQDTLFTAVLVVGGGTGGTAAALSSARTGVATIVAEEGPWLGGMLSSAGVSATDGNDKLPSGIWKEFRDALEQAYHGKAGLATGWVSNTAFEPHVADSIFKSWARQEKNLIILYHLRPTGLIRSADTIKGATFVDLQNGNSLAIMARQTIEATEQGDVLALGEIPFDLGMEAGASTGEHVGVDRSSDIVQDLTWVAVLQDFGPGKDHTIPMPPGYDPAAFDGACSDFYHDSTRKKPTNSAKAMLEYGRLPNGKYMLNWPIYGNDTYLNTVGMTPSERVKTLDSAKVNTLRFIYFIQHELGYRNLGPAIGEFPSGNGLALIPYYRESRRVRGTVRFTMPDLATAFSRADALYRTGIAVGDYPIDHHHKKNPLAPQHLDFYPVPSFSIPLGCLIPEHTDGLVAADKNISVSNVVNGTTRLQPVVLLTGQAAGILAALAAQKGISARDVPVREVQDELLKRGAMLMPYLDVPPSHPAFLSVQRIGATGLLRGRGVPHQWDNQTWFDPDLPAQADSLFKYWNEWVPIPAFPKGGRVTLNNLAAPLVETLRSIAGRSKVPDLKTNEMMLRHMEQEKSSWGLSAKNMDEALTRAELAVVLDRSIDLYHLAAVDLKGHFLHHR
jgi:hypothetical protein